MSPSTPRAGRSAGRRRGCHGPVSATEYAAIAHVEVHALDPSRPRRVTSHAGRKLIGSVYLKGDEAGPLTIRLQPWGTITGRVVDDDGQPRGGPGTNTGVFPKRPAVQGILPGAP